MSSENQPQERDIKLLKEIADEISDLSFSDKQKLHKIRNRLKMIIKNIFDESDDYLARISNISFTPRMVGRATRKSKLDKWNSGKKKLLNLVEILIEQRELFGNSSKTKKEMQNTDSSNVFVVHGHDEEMKQNVARTLQNLDLNPIILHEQPNRGRTIIEKFEDYSTVGFAIVLLSPEDKGILEEDGEEVEVFRARQNVILEWGFFLGKLGRERVVALHKKDEDFEMPSDYDGVLYIPYDDQGRWKLDVVQELDEADFDVDANKLIGQ